MMIPAKYQKAVDCIRDHPHSIDLAVNGRRIKGDFRALDAEMLGRSLGVKPGGWLRLGAKYGLHSIRCQQGVYYGVRN